MTSNADGGGDVRRFSIRTPAGRLEAWHDAARTRGVSLNTWLLEAAETRAQAEGSSGTSVGEFIENAQRFAGEHAQIIVQSDRKIRVVPGSPEHWKTFGEDTEAWTSMIDTLLIRAHRLSADLDHVPGDVLAAVRLSSLGLDGNNDRAWTARIGALYPFGDTDDEHAGEVGVVVGALGVLARPLN